MAIAYQSDGSVICTGNADQTRTATYPGPLRSAAQDLSVKNFFNGDQAPGVDNSPEALRAAIPVAAGVTPPAVGDAGTMGALSEFARGDHTHASKVRKQRVTGVNTATYPWTYPSPFSNGVVPIVQAVAEDPANSTVDSYNIQVVGAPTATQAVIRIVRQTSGLFGLLLGAIGFNSTPGNVTLHLLALEP